MWNKIKAFYNKEDCDLSTGYIDPFEFHKIFYYILEAFKVTAIENPHPPSYLNQNAFIVIYGSISMTFTLLCVYHGVDVFDLPLITEAGTYTILFIYELIIVSCTWRNLPQYHNFLRALREDFHYICTVGDKYRVRFFENQLLTWKICVVICVFNVSVPIGMLLFELLALFYFLATQTPGEEGSRPLLFPFWVFDVDFTKTPIFEAAFLFSNTSALLYAYNYTFMAQTQIVWVRQITSKADLVIWSIQDLLVDIRPATNEEERVLFSRVIQARMRDIIMHHQSMYRLLDDFAKIHKKFLMFEEKSCSYIVCLCAYCIAEKMDDGEFQVILLILCVSVIVLHFIPSYLCTYLEYKVNSICDACWSCPFWNAGSVVRPYMVLIMQRSLRPLPLQTPGFQNVSIETFSKEMTSAYSLFNMLRQAN